MALFGFAKKKLFGTLPPLFNKPMGFITKLLEKQFKESPLQSTPNVSLQRLRAAVSLVHAHFLLNSAHILNGVEGKLFSPSRKQHSNKESWATDLFGRLNFDSKNDCPNWTIIFWNCFLRNSLQNLIKITYVKSRDEELQTETEILQTETRPETFDTETSKNGSQDRDHVSRLHHCCLHGHKPSNKNFAPVNNQGFCWTKSDVHRLTTTLNKKRKCN